MAIELIDKIKPKNSGTFAMVDAADVEMPDGRRLSEISGDILPAPGGATVGQMLRVAAVDENGKVTAVEAVPGISNVVPVTQAQYQALVDSGTLDPNAMYVIVGESV